MRLLMIGLLGITAGSGISEPSPAVLVRDTTIAISTFRFRPTTLVVPAGTRVVWSNEDEIEHTVTAGIPDSSTGGFTGVLAARGSGFAYTFNQAGTFSYYCNRHHFMRGEIRVTSQGEY